jgi:hypothetical protein
MGWTQAFIAYILVSHVQGIYLFLNFALSHTHLHAMKKEDEMDWVPKPLIIQCILLEDFRLIGESFENLINVTI